jgi:hypothetical protein
MNGTLQFLDKVLTSVLIASFITAMIYRKNIFPLIMILISYSIIIPIETFNKAYVPLSIDIIAAVMWGRLLALDLKMRKKEKQLNMAKLTFVGKVQAPLASSDPNPSVYIYDESRETSLFTPFTEEISNKLNGRPKAYFNLTIEGNENRGYELVDIGEEVADPGW